MQFVLLYGPPAVGKLTIAKVLAAKTGYKLLHNHLIVNPIAEIFSFENPSNRLLTREFRLRIIEEAARDDISFINTFGIAGNDPFSHINEIIDTLNKSNGTICLVQLTADKETILERVEDSSRKDHGKNLTKERLEEIINDNSDIFDKYPNTQHLTINTSKISPDISAQEIIDYYKLA